MRSVSRSALPRLLCALVGLLLTMAFAPSVSSAAITITYSPANPVSGEQVTFDNSYVSDCTDTYVYSIDGVAQPAQTTRPFTWEFSEGGTHTVAVTATSSCDGNTDSGSRSVLVEDALTGSIASSPDPPNTGREATLTATSSGGFAPPYYYAWDLDDDGQFDDSESRTPTTVFETAGPHVVRVRIRDSAEPVHEITVTRTLNVVDYVAPPPPAPGAPAPDPPPPCTKRLAFGLSEFKTTGCFTRTPNEVGKWETTSAVKLNGISFPDYGQRFVITLPTPGAPGGRFTAPDSAMRIGDVTAYSGDIDWDLPDGDAGEDQEWRSVSVPTFAELFGLRVRGSVGVRLGIGGDGKHYAVFPLHVELPAVFKPAPDPGAESVTGDASLRVDDDGPRYDGLKIEVEDVWVGRLRVPEACFSFVPGGASEAVAPCEGPTLDGEPYLTCNSDAEVDRWDGNATIELPVSTKTAYTMFGGVADGQVSKLGGIADNIGTLKIPLGPGIFLNRLGAGLCLSPPPFKVRGDVGAEALGGALVVNGRFLYTDAFGNDPWSVEVGGNVLLAGTELGRGFVKLNAWGDVDFALSAAMDFDVASIEGQVNGWLEPRNDLFNVEGSVKACLGFCATASGVVSSTGVAGCLDAGEIVIHEPYNARQGPFGFGSISFSTRERRYPLKAGFGHVYGEGVDLLGNSCDFAPYSATRATGALARLAQVGSAQQIAPGTKAVSLRVRGTDGPPKVVVRGPDGTVITSPTDKTGARRKGKYMLAENKTNGTTSVLLVRPAAGTWSIKAAPGTASKPTRVDRATYEAPATFVGRIRRTARGRDFVMAYAAPKGAKVRLMERGKGISQTIVPEVRGTPCQGQQTLRGRKLRCARVRFKPSRGPGGVRRVQAVVSRGGIPLSQSDVASFRAPDQKRPSRPGALRARRGTGIIQVSLPRSAGASRYTASAVLSDGRRLGFDLEQGCQAFVITGVPRDVSATVKVAGLRYDTAMGKTRSVTLKGGSVTAGPRGKLPRRLWRPRVVCD